MFAKTASASPMLSGDDSISPARASARCTTRGET
jgi:hypothetical protein